LQNAKLINFHGVAMEMEDGKIISMSCGYVE